MSSPVPPPAVPSRPKRFSWPALAVALVSDVLSVGFELVPPLQLALDVTTALALWALCGWRWPLLPALIVEAIPGLALFPTWSLVVGTLPLLDRARKSGDDSVRPKSERRARGRDELGGDESL